MSGEENQFVTDTTTEAVQQAESESVGAPPSGPAEGARPSAAPGMPGERALDIVIDVPLKVTVEIGSARMRVKEVLQLSRGSVRPSKDVGGVSSRSVSQTKAKYP